MPTHRKATRNQTVMSTALVLVLGLSGCEQMSAFSDKMQGSVGGTSIPGVVDSPQQANLRIEERDVEAPDVFSVNDEAMWDGRPSFGGVWAAVPGNVQPERVRIENGETGKSVVGALFKREAANPGPPIEVSSDAATALGMIPGQPATLSITALRRETIDVTPAIDESAGPAPVIVQSGEEPLAEAVDASSTDTGNITTTPLVETAVLSQAIDNAPDDARPGTAQDTAPQTRPATSETPVASAASNQVPDRPFVQVGTFRSESNANGLTQILGDNNIAAVVRSQTMDNGRKLYRVVAGPAATQRDLSTLADRISSLGFTDAFLVSK